LQRETHTIPIVFTSVSDPVGSGFVASLRKPGGNITGFINMEASLSGKWVELIHEIAPFVSRMAILFNPQTAPFAQYYLDTFRSAATAFSVDIIEAPVHSKAEIEAFMTKLGHESGAGIVVMPDTHRLVAIDRCPVLAKSLDGAIDTAWGIAETIGPVRKPLDIHVTTSDAGLDIDVRGSGPLPPHLITALARLAGQRDIARVTRHSELIAQLRAPTVRMGKAIVHLPPAAFLQATAEGEAVLARLVVEACDDAANVADLFAGIGPFALRLAEAAHVFAVDDDDVALAALKRAAATTAGLKPVATETRDLFRGPLGVTELKRFDAVVFDPPRQGALAQARELAASGVPLVVAVSCNPATFARDASELVRDGYRLSSVAPVDQFRYAAHVEIVACFTK